MRSPPALGPGPASGPNRPFATSVLNPNLVGIRGWLIIPAISLALGGIQYLVLFIGLPILIHRADDPGQARYLGMILLTHICIFGCWLVTVRRFFGRKKSAPATMIGFILVQLAAGIMFMAAEYFIKARVVPAAGIEGLIRQMVFAAIWIPYFLVSSRVAMTFRK